MEMMSSGSDKLEALTILVADDDPATRIMLKTALTGWGFKVVEVEDGDAAWRAINQFDAPQLLLLDCNMPGQDGYALTARIRKELSSDYNPYIVLLTHAGGSENVVRGLDAGANEFLTKPFHVAELRSRILVGEKIVRYETALAEQNKQLKYYISQIEAASNLVVNASQSLGTAMRDAHNKGKLPGDNEELNTLNTAHSAMDEIADVFKNFHPEKSSKKTK